MDKPSGPSGFSKPSIPSQSSGINWPYAFIGILVVAFVISVYFVMQADAQVSQVTSDLKASQNNEAALNTQVSALASQNTNLQTQLDTAKAQETLTKTQLFTTTGFLAKAKAQDRDQLATIFAMLNSSTTTLDTINVESNYTQVQNYDCGYYFGGFYSGSVSVPLGCSLAISSLLTSVGAFVNDTNNANPLAVTTLVQGYIANETA